MYARDWTMGDGLLASAAMPAGGPAEHGRDGAVLALDREGRVVCWDRQAERLLGAGDGELRGRHCLSLLTRYAQSSAKRDRALQIAAAAGRFETQGWKRRADGSRFWACMTVAPILDQTAHGLAYLATVRDLTEGKRRADELRVALEISRALLAGQPQGAVLQLVARRARALVGGDCALVRTPGAGGSVLVLRAAAWRCRRDAVRTRPASELPRAASIDGRVFDSGRPRMVLHRRPAPAPSRAREGRRSGWGPALFVPLSAQNRTLGTLMVQNWRSGRPFQRQDLEVLRRLASQAALALHNAQASQDRDRQAVMDERERLGRELHDGAMQSLYAVTLGLADVIARTGDGGLQEQMGSLAARIDGVVQGLRAHVHRLRQDP